jgi:hypothetical protein
MITRAAFVIPGDYFAGGIVYKVIPVNRDKRVAIVTSNPDLTSSVYRMSIQAMVWIIPRENGK